MSNEKPFYTLKELADMLGIKHKSVYNLVYAGKLPARKWGGRWIVTKKDFERFLEELPMAGRPNGRR